MPMPTDFRPRLILGTHDLGLRPPAEAGRRDYWMPFAEFRHLLAEVDTLAAASGFSVELTSDDGFASDAEEMLPWLVETKRRASFFVPTGFVGRAGHLALTELRAIHAAGMSVGLHGIDHLNWVEATAAELEREVVAGKRALEDLIGAPVTTAAPPYGAYNGRVVAALNTAGIATVYTCRGGFCTRPGLLRPRVMVRSGVHAERLKALAQRGARASDNLRLALHDLQLAVGR